MNLFDTIRRVVLDDSVRLEEKDNKLLIINQKNQNRIIVYEENSSNYHEYIVEFSTQHRHFEEEDEDELMEYITFIMKDQILPIEFYQDGKRRFGSEIKKEDLENLSLAFFMKELQMSEKDLLSLQYEIHSWSGTYDTGLRKVSDRM